MFLLLSGGLSSRRIISYQITYIVILITTILLIFFCRTFFSVQEKQLVEFRKSIEAVIGEPLKPVFGTFCSTITYPQIQLTSTHAASHPTTTQTDKFYLRRFLRARQHDLPRAKEMFLNHLKWRKEMGIDTILDDFHFHERDAFLTLYPQGYHKTDRLGRPVYIQHLGQINVKALAKVTTEERMLRFHIQEYERALRYIFPACSLIAGQYVGQTLAVMDLKGVGLRHLSGEVKRILSTITRTDQDNYPETLGKTLIINAPTVFRAIWAVVKPMLDTRTQAKIQVCSSDYLSELTRWVAPENIPQYLGGKSQGSLLDDVGPWHDEALRAEIDAQRERLERGGEVGEDGLLGGGGGSGSFMLDSPANSIGRSIHPAIGGFGGIGDATATASEKEEFFDATMTRRLSSVSSAAESAYLSADDGMDSVYYSSSDVGGGSGVGRGGRGRRPPPVDVAAIAIAGQSSEFSSDEGGGDVLLDVDVEKRGRRTSTASSTVPLMGAATTTSSGGGGGNYESKYIGGGGGECQSSNFYFGSSQGVGRTIACS